MRTLKSWASFLALAVLAACSGGDGNGGITAPPTPPPPTVIPFTAALLSPTSSSDPVSGILNVVSTAKGGKTPYMFERRLDGQMFSIGQDSTASLDLKTVTPGPHAVEVVATDANGTKITTSVNIVVGGTVSATRGTIVSKAHSTDFILLNGPSTWTLDLEQGFLGLQPANGVLPGTQLGQDGSDWASYDAPGFTGVNYPVSTEFLMTDGGQITVKASATFTGAAWSNKNVTVYFVRVDGAKLGNWVFKSTLDLLNNQLGGSWKDVLTAPKAGAPGYGIHPSFTAPVLPCTAGEGNSTATLHVEITLPGGKLYLLPDQKLTKSCP